MRYSSLCLSLCLSLCVLLFSIVSIQLVTCHQGSDHQHQQQFQNQNQNQQQNANNGNNNAAMHNINKEHVLEHLDGVINKPKDQMTVDEQNFYYFKLHDYDNNNVLDGLELVTAFAHNLNSDGIFYNKKKKKCFKLPI